MISDEFRTIFIHIPRTGGSSIENLIWPQEHLRIPLKLWMGFIDPYHNKYQTGGLQHLFACQIQKEVGYQKFKSYFKFSIVRNPWDKAVSQYHFISRRKDLMDFIQMKKEDSFKVYLHKIQKRKHVQWDHQYKFVLNQHGDQLVDYIGRYEQFEADVRYILKEVKHPACAESFKLPHLNRSHRTHYSAYYDSESMGMVDFLYAKDIKYFKYAFESLR